MFPFYRSSYVSGESKQTITLVHFCHHVCHKNLVNKAEKRFVSVGSLTGDRCLSLAHLASYKPKIEPRDAVLTRLFSKSSRMKVMALVLMPMNRLMQDSETYAVLGMLNT